jgi:leukotriene-A4 hydrolase
MPPVTNTYDTSLATAAYDLAMRWHTCDVMGVGSELCSARQACMSKGLE